MFASWSYIPDVLFRIRRQTLLGATLVSSFSFSFVVNVVIANCMKILEGVKFLVAADYDFRTEFLEQLKGFDKVFGKVVRIVIVIFLM